MKNKLNKFLFTLTLAGIASSASALDITGWSYYTYGNTNSYSLSGMATIYDALYGGGTGPSNPYYVDSGPGQIKDTVVIYTGANGGPVQTNSGGFENAYLTPSGGSQPYANTVGSISLDSNGVANGVYGATINTWDAQISSLLGFLDGGTPLFLFNNNETNTGEDSQHLAIWAKLWITDAAGGIYNDRYLYLSNEGAAYGLGGQNNGDAYAYNPGNLAGANAGTLTGTDYVMSGGQICFSSMATGFQSVLCDGNEAYRIDHNLGANQAAYAGSVPLLNDWLDTLSASSEDLSKWTMHLQFELGCVNSTLGIPSVCVDNGYEQLFMVSAPRPNQVSEPPSIVLLGFALLGFAATRRRKDLT